MSAASVLAGATVTFTSDRVERLDTTLSMYVSSRVFQSLPVMLASAVDLVDARAWGEAAPSGRSYPLPTTAVTLSELSGDIGVRLAWTPLAAPSRCVLAYDLELAFSVSGAAEPAVLRHHVEKVSLDEPSGQALTTITLAAARRALGGR